MASPGRALRSFWVLTFLAIVATGSLTAALAAPVGALTGIRVALSGLAVIVTVSLTARVLVAFERSKRRSGGERRCGR